MQSQSTTVQEYLASLPEDRRAALAMVRQVILEKLPRGYEEVMNWGMICYQVPRSACPQTYNGQPLMYAALASQKNHMAVYLTAVYMDDSSRRDFEAKYRATGKRMDMGKSCVRFRRLDDLPLDVVGNAIAWMPMKEFVERVTAVHSVRAARKPR
jgi:uncharacterized protein YdhG (YjbR/CyaY superfamily)